ncbi:MAG TPA: hypothetical protein VGX00_08585 [Thermoplasmata archaeon]|nr:hypothetical protein [Thermoplasmata archaeon]
MPEQSVSGFSYKSDTVAAFKTILEAWQPSDLDDKRRDLPKTEKGWERSLVDHVRLMVPSDLNVIPQGGAGMKHGDIVVERKGLLGGIVRDIIELKMGLSTTGNYQRLIGQVDDYLKEGGSTIVVICGEDTDPKLIKQLETRYPSTTSKLGIFWKKSSKKGVSQLFPREGGGFELPSVKLPTFKIG